MKAFLPSLLFEGFFTLFLFLTVFLPLLLFLLVLAAGSTRGSDSVFSLSVFTEAFLQSRELELDEVPCPGRGSTGRSVGSTS